MWANLSTSGNVLQAGWVRRRYYVRDGYIRPIPESPAEAYDPFASYSGSDYDLVGRSLYLDLVELDTEDERAIETFATRWGLLGLLQHNLVQIRHVDWSDTDWLTKKGDGIIPDITELYETPGLLPEDSEIRVEITPSTFPGDYIGDELGSEWETPPNVEIDAPLRELLVSYQAAELDAEGEFTIVDRNLAWRVIQIAVDRRHERKFKAWFSNTKHPLGSVLYEAPNGVIQEAPAISYYSRYLPDRSPLRETPPRDPRPPSELTDVELEQRILSIGVESGLNPCLRSVRLWNALCEPLDEFRAAAARFRATYALCTQCPPRSSSSPSPELPHEDRYRRIELRRYFAREMRRVHPVPNFDPNTGAWSWSWSFRSLLSAAYAMMFLDLVIENRRLAFCGNRTCGKSFVTERSDRKYCSDRCLNTQKQRDYRSARNKQPPSK